MNEEIEKIILDAICEDDYKAVTEASNGILALIEQRVIDAMDKEVENEEAGIDPETGYNHHARESYMYCYKRMKAAVRETMK